MDLIIHQHQNTATTTARRQCHLRRSQQIGRAVVARLAGRAHGTGHYQWHIERPEQIKEIRRFLEAVGTLGQYHRVCSTSHLAPGPGQHLEHRRKAQRGTGEQAQSDSLKMGHLTQLWQLGQLLSAVKLGHHPAFACTCPHTHRPSQAGDRQPGQVCMRFHTPPPASSPTSGTIASVLMAIDTTLPM
ncbi:hypothetical protein D3C80_1419990 [compost metagenome]